MEALLFLGILTSGLVAGLFFGWSVAAIPGLARVSDQTYVTTMQSINRAILNPLFLVVFMGTVVVLAAASISYFMADRTAPAWWLTAATATYAVGVLGITIGGNVPLNNALESFDLDGAADDAVSDQRRGYETQWNRWHTIRTVAAVVALGLATVAALTTATTVG